MGSGCVSLNVDSEFPPNLGTVAVAVSGGIESAAMLLIAAQVYGADNVHAYTCALSDRKQWEPVIARRVAEKLGIVHCYDYYTPSFDVHKLIRSARVRQDYGGYFIGTHRDYHLDMQDVSRGHKFHVYHPFIALYKHETIDLLYQYGRPDIIQYTHSCTRRGSTHCGRCGSCLTRVRGFDQLHKADSATYDRDWDSMVKECYK